MADPTAAPDGAVRLDDDAAGALLPERPARGHKGSFGKLLVIAGSLDYAGAALLVCRAARPDGRRAGDPRRPRIAPAAVRRQGRRGDDDGPARGRRRGDRPEAGAGPDPRPRARRDGRRAGTAARPVHGGPGPRAHRGGRAPRRRRSSSTPRRSARSRRWTRWWTSDDAAGRPDAPCRGVRPAPGGHGASTPRPTATSWPTTPRGSRPPATAATTWGQVVVLKGAATVVAAPDGSVAIAPFENPALATGGTGDVLAGAIGALLAQGLDPFAAARLGVYLHGLAGDGVRERFGDAGLLASDLPDGTRARPEAPGRRRRAPSCAGTPGVRGTDRRTGRGRCRDRGPGAGTRIAHAGPGLSRLQSRGMARTDPETSVDERLAAAGLPPLPRTAWLEIDLDALASQPSRSCARRRDPACSIRPVVKADAYGHGVAAGRPGAGGGRRRRPVRRDARRGARSAAGPHPGADPRALPDPGRLGARSRSQGASRSAPGTPACWSRRSRRSGPGAEPVRAACGSSSRWRPVSVGAGSRPRRSSRRPRRSGRAATPSRPACGPTCRRPRTASARMRQLGRFETAAAAMRSAGIRLPARHATASVEPPERGGRSRRLRRRPPGPLHLRPGPRGARPGPPRRRGRPRTCDRSSPCTPGRCASPTCRRAGASATGPRSSPSGPAGSRRCRSGYGDGWPRSLSNRASALVRGRRVPLVGNVAMDAVMADVTDVPGPPVTAADEFMLIGRQGDLRDHRRRAGAGTHHELVGGRNGHVPAVTPGVLCRDPDRSGLRTLLSEWS